MADPPIVVYIKHSEAGVHYLPAFDPKRTCGQQYTGSEEGASACVTIVRSSLSTPLCIPEFAAGTGESRRTQSANLTRGITNSKHRCGCCVDVAVRKRSDKRC
jgi:hypothetical protein